MRYEQWRDMNIDYEKGLLPKIISKFGKKSREYKNKVEQIKDLRNGEST